MRYVIALLLCASSAYALPDRPAPQKEPLPVAPRVCNYCGVVVTFDGESLTIDDPRYFGSGRISEDGSIPIAWLDKEKNEVTHVGCYWFGEYGALEGVWRNVSMPAASPERLCVAFQSDGLTMVASAPSAWGFTN